MRKSLLAFLLLAASALAQNFEVVTAAQIQGGGGILLPSGLLSFQPVDGSGNPIGYQVGGGGQSITWPTVCSVSNGAIVGGCLLPNVSLTNPMNVCFALTVTNTQGQTILTPAAGYSCVQPQTTNNWCSAGTCDFDQFIPNSPNYITAKLGPPQIGSLGGVYAGDCGAGFVTIGINASGHVDCVAGGGGGGGGISGPTVSALNDVVLWNNTVGTAVSDAGFGFPLAPAHIGTLMAGVNGLATSATTDTTNASNISSGTLPHARLPALLSGDIPNNAANTTGTAGGLSANIAESQVTNLTSDLAARVLTSTTVNGNALSSNVVVSASQITTGTLPHAQLPALQSADIPNNAANTSGNAATATNLAASPSQCSGGQFALGVAVSGNANCGTPAGSGNVSNVGTPTNGQVGIWNSATTLAGVNVLPSGNFPAQTGDVTNSAGSVSTTVGGLLGHALPSIATGTLSYSGSAWVLAATTFASLSGSAACSQLPALTGDATTSAGSCGTTVGKINGTLVPASAALLGTNSGSQPVALTVVPTSTFPALTGDVTGTAGSLSVTVTKINGTALSGLATGILKNTTSTGVPSIAGAGDFPTLNQSTTGNAATATALAATPAQCSGSQFATGITAAGVANCATPAGSGNVNNVGTPTNGQLGVWTGATTLSGVTTLPTAAMPALTGDVTNTGGSLATTVGKVNGGALPASKTIVGTNSSSQIIDASSATLANNTTGTAGGVQSATSDAATTGLINLAHGDAIKYKSATSGGSDLNLATGATGGDTTRTQIGDTPGILVVGPTEIQDPLSLTGSGQPQQYTTNSLAGYSCQIVAGQSAWCFQPSTGAFTVSQNGGSFAAPGGSGVTWANDLVGSTNSSQTVVGIQGHPIANPIASVASVAYWSGSALSWNPVSNFTTQGNFFNGATELVQTNSGGQIPAGVVPTLNQSTTGNAGTASALASTPSQCTGSQFAQGIAANGNANCANTPSGGGGSGSVPIVAPVPSTPLGLSLTAASTVANTGSATSLLTTYTGSNVIRAGSMLPTTSATKTIRLHAAGTLGTAGSPPTLTVTPKLGGVSLGAISVPVTASLSGATWELNFYFTVESLTTASTGGCFNFYGSAGAMIGGCATSGSVSGLNFASDQSLDVTVTWGTASSSNTITANQLSEAPEQRI